MIAGIALPDQMLTRRKLARAHGRREAFQRIIAELGERAACRGQQRQDRPRRRVGGPGGFVTIGWHARHTWRSRAYTTSASMNRRSSDPRASWNARENSNRAAPAYFRAKDREKSTLP